MACNCKNDDGSLSKVCFGTCIKKSIRQQEENASRDPLNGFAELIMSQVSNMLDYKIQKIQIRFQEDQIKLYKSAFLEGINEGIKICRSTTNSEY